jgi:hydrogenase-4 component B
VVSILDTAGRDLDVLRTAPSLISASAFQGLRVADFSFVSAPLLCALFIAVFVVVLLSTRFAINRNQKIRTGATWNCGSD